MHRKGLFRKQIVEDEYLDEYHPWVSAMDAYQRARLLTLSWNAVSESAITWYSKPMGYWIYASPYKHCQWTMSNATCNSTQWESGVLRKKTTFTMLVYISSLETVLKLCCIAGKLCSKSLILLLWHHFQNILSWRNLQHFFLSSDIMRHIFVLIGSRIMFFLSMPWLNSENFLK